MCLNAQRVLIYGDNVLICEYAFGVVTHVAKIVASHQRSCQHAPHREVALVFNGIHAAVAHFKHIRVVPVTRTVVRVEVLNQVDYVHHTMTAPVFATVPQVDDVAGGSPEVTYAFAPFPRFGAAPFADAENDRTTGFFQSLAHDGVGGF